MGLFHPGGMCSEQILGSFGVLLASQSTTLFPVCPGETEAEAVRATDQHSLGQIQECFSTVRLSFVRLGYRGRLCP